MLVHQQTHQLRATNRRVRVVELQRSLLGEVFERLILVVTKYRRMMSCSVALTMKNCCFRRSSLP